MPYSRRMTVAAQDFPMIVASNFYRTLVNRRCNLIEEDASLSLPPKPMLRYQKPPLLMKERGVSFEQLARRLSGVELELA